MSLLEKIEDLRDQLKTVSRVEQRENDYLQATELQRQIASLCQTGRFHQEALEYQIASLQSGEKANLTESSLATLHSELGVIYTSLYNYECALEMFNRSLAFYVDECGENSDSSGIAQVYNNIGVMLRKQCKYIESMEYHNKALEMFERLSVSGMDGNLALTYRLIGEGQVEMCHIEQALEMFQNSERIYDELCENNCLSKEDVVAYMKLHCLKGDVYRLLGMFQCAEKEYITAVGLSEEYFEGAIIMEDMESYIGLAETARALDNYNEAKKHIESVFAVVEELLGDGENTQPFLLAVHSIIRLGTSKCDVKRVLDFHERSMALSKELHIDEPSHPDIANSHNLFGDFLRKSAGQYSKALVNHFKALAMFQDSYGDAAIHKDIADTYEYIGQVYADIGDCARARKYYDEARAVIDQLYNGEKLNTALVENSIHIGELLVKQKQFDKALDYFKDVVDTMKELYKQGLTQGHSNQEMARAYNRMGMALRGTGEEYLAMQHYEDALLLGQGGSPDFVGRPIEAESRNLLGDFYSHNLLFGEAFKVYKKNISECEEFVKKQDDMDTSFDLVRTLLKAAVAAFKHGTLKLSKECLDKCHAHVDSLFANMDKTHPLVAFLYIQMGNYFEIIGEFDAAIARYKDALHIYEEAFKEYSCHPDISSCLYNLGCFHYRAGLYATAVECYNDSAYIERYRSPHSIAFAMCCEGIGCALVKMKKFGEAEQNLKKSLQIKQDFHKDNPYHKDLAEIYAEFGNLSTALGDCDLAMQYFTKSLDINKRLAGENFSRQEVGRCYDNIGNTFCYQGQWNQATNALKTALDMKLEAQKYDRLLRLDRADVDPNKPAKDALTSKLIREISYQVQLHHDPSIAMTHCYLGNVHYCDGLSIHHHGDNEVKRKPKFRQALAQYNRSLELLRNVYKITGCHPNIATVLSNIGLVKQQNCFQSQDNDNYDEALQYHLDALDMREKLYSENPDHPEVAVCYNNLGNVYQLQGDYANAMRFCSGALCKYKTFYKADTVLPEVANVHENIGTIHFRQGMFDKALSAYTQCYQIRVDLFGEFKKFNAALASIYVNLSNTHEQIGNKRQSEKCREMAKKITVRSADDRQTDNTCGVM